MKIVYQHDGGPFEATIEVTDKGSSENGKYLVELAFSDATDFNRFMNFCWPDLTPWPCLQIQKYRVVE